MTDRPADDLNAGKAFYHHLLPGLDVEYFGAMWHTVTIAHLVMGNLEDIARGYQLGIGDLFILGTLRIKQGGPRRATDLAQTLFLTNAAITVRTRHLISRGLVRRENDPADRRAFWLHLTAAGETLIDAAIGAIAKESHYTKAFQQLDADDRQRLEKILGRIHTELDRFFHAG